MAITKEEFERFERVRFAYDIDYIAVISELSRDKVIGIMDTYNSLSKRYRE